MQENDQRDKIDLKKHYNGRFHVSDRLLIKTPNAGEQETITLHAKRKT